MFNSRFNIGLTAILGLLTVVSCKKDTPSWDVNLLGPVAYSSMTIYDLLADSLLQSNPDSSVNLVFTDNVYTLELDSIWDIPDTTLREVYKQPFVFTVPPGSQFITGSSDSQYELEGAQLYEVVIREGSVAIVLTSTVDQPTQFVYKIINATLSGVPFETTVDIPAAVGGVPSSVNAQLDLSGYHLDLRGPMGDSENFMQTEFTANVHPLAPGDANINGSADSVTLDYSFVGFVPQYARGYFGQKTVSIGPESTPTGLFGIIESGTIDVDQVSVELELVNRIGVDGRATPNLLESINSSTGSTVPLSNSVIGTTMNLTRVLDGGGYPLPSYQTVLLDNSNSNIDLFMENLPTDLNYAIDFEINPLGNVMGGNDFFYYGNTFEANLNLNIPLCLIANQLTLIDTTEFEYPDEPGGELLDGTLYAMAENGFPFDASMQVYLLDENRVVLDSITSYDIINAGVVNASQVVVATTSSTLTYTVSSDQVANLRNTSYLVLKPSFSTVSSTQHAKIYDHYALELKVTTDFNFQYQGE